MNGLLIKITLRMKIINNQLQSGLSFKNKKNKKNFIFYYN